MRKQYDFSKGKRGPVIVSPGKTRITMMLDDDIIEHFSEHLGPDVWATVQRLLAPEFGPLRRRGPDRAA